MAASIRVLICDDHALVRSGLRKLLECEADLEVVGEAANADEAIERSRAAAPDVVLLDVVMPGRSGIDALPDILARLPRRRCSCSRCSRTPCTSAVHSPPARAATSSRTRPDAELVEAIHDRRRRAALRPPVPRRAARRGRGGRREPGCLRPAVRARASGSPATGARPHEPGDREAALPLASNRRDPPRADRPQARAQEPRGARPLRDRLGRARLESSSPAPRSARGDPATGISDRADGSGGGLGEALGKGGGNEHRLHHHRVCLRDLGARRGRGRASSR